MSSIDKTGLDALKGLGLTRDPAAEKKRSELGQEDFLSLMTAQLRNQDPMKPMANGEFLTQIAQFSQASGIKDLQDSFSSLSRSLTSSQALQASSLVGREVLIPGDTAAYGPDRPVQGVVEVPASTQSVSVTVLDSAGQPVRRIDLGAQPAGEAAFRWDGLDDAGDQAPAGTYRLQAEYGAGGHSVAASTLVTAKVDSVTVGGMGEGVRLNLAGREPAALGDVRRIM